GRDAPDGAQSAGGRDGAQHPNGLAIVQNIRQRGARLLEQRPHDRVRGHDGEGGKHLGAARFVEIVELVLLGADTQRIEHDRLEVVAEWVRLGREADAAQIQTHRGSPWRPPLLATPCCVKASGCRIGPTRWISKPSCRGWARCLVWQTSRRAPSSSASRGCCPPCCWSRPSACERCRGPRVWRWGC